MQQPEENPFDLHESWNDFFREAKGEKQRQSISGDSLVLNLPLPEGIQVRTDSVEAVQEGSWLVIRMRKAG